MIPVLYNKRFATQLYKRKGNDKQEVENADYLSWRKQVDGEIIRLNVGHCKISTCFVERVRACAQTGAGEAAKG